jgi:tRNA G10  N-methylase Trm11
MTIIIASDIFGRTLELEDFAADLSSKSMKAIILDPYQGKSMEFKDESKAYAYFQKMLAWNNTKTLYSKLLSKI